MDIAKMVGLEQGSDGLFKQFEEAKFEVVEGNPVFTHGCTEALYFDHNVLVEAERNELVYEYRKFARLLAIKLKDAAIELEPTIVVYPQIGNLVVDAVAGVTKRILEADAPYSGCFQRKNSILVKIFFGIKKRANLPPILMLDVRTEEWMVVKRKGTAVEFIPNGLLERVTQPKKG